MMRNLALPPASAQLCLPAPVAVGGICLLDVYPLPPEPPGAERIAALARLPRDWTAAERAEAADLLRRRAGWLAACGSGYADATLGVALALRVPLQYVDGGTRPVAPRGQRRRAAARNLAVM